MTNQTAVQLYEGPAQVRSDLDDMRERLAAQLPRGMDPDRFAATAARTVISNPALMECDRVSLMQAITSAAELGLEPSGLLGSAYIVPYNRRVKDGKAWRTVKVAQLIPGYRGLIDLARRGGEVLKVEARIVRAMDDFQLDYGAPEPVQHRPFIPDPTAAPAERDPGPIVGAYMRAVLRGDPVPQVEWMTYDEIAQVRKRSKAADGGPWVTDESEMMRKTVVRRGSKYLPLSTDFRTALELDEVAERDAAPLEIAQPKLSTAQQLLVDRAQPPEPAPVATETPSEASEPQGPASAAVEDSAPLPEPPAELLDHAPGTCKPLCEACAALVPSAAGLKRADGAAAQDGDVVVPGPKGPVAVDPKADARATCNDDGGMLGRCSRAPGHTRKHQSAHGEWPQERKSKSK